MKRAYSDSDMEDEDGYNTERCADGEDDETIARKRRRGLIEKKRRDRINSCLTELRRLVPAAVDKQGSTKLEKAEILQLTVEHLRNVRNIAKRDKVSNEGADFRAAGFRECLSEVARYLQSFQDPNCKDDQKVQLMSHLNTIVTHRLTASPQVYQSRTPMTPPVVWPLTRGVTAQAIYHDTTTLPLNAAKLKTAPNSLNENLVNKDKNTLNKSQDVVMSQVPDIGIRRPLQGHYPFTMYPTHCNRNDNMIMGFPLPQQRNDVPKPDQIIFGTNARTMGPDPSLIKTLFCQPF